jgi:hypothetical protein
MINIMVKMGISNRLDLVWREEVNLLGGKIYIS